MKKITSIFVVLAVLAMMIPATSSAQDDGILFWITGDENSAAFLQAASELFTEETGIPVTVEAVGWGEAYARYLTSVNSGEGADMFAGGMSWGISLGDLGGLVDLSQAFPDEYQAVLDANNPAFVGAIVGVDGAVYGVPYNQDVQLMFYMPEALAEVGFDAPPVTWEELEAVLAALNEVGKTGGIGWGNAGWIGFQPFLEQAGGSWYTDDCSASAINSEEGLAALEFFTALYDEYGFPQETADVGGGFSTGDLALVIEGEWAAPGINASYPDLEGHWAVATQPVGPAGNGAAFLGGSMAGIFSHSDKVDESWQFLQWLQTAEAQEAITEQAYNLSTLFLPPQPENDVFIRGDEAVASVLAAQLKDVTAPPHCAGWEESNPEVNIILQTVLFEGGAFEDALLEMEDLLNTNLEYYGN